MRSPTFIGTVLRCAFPRRGKVRQFSPPGVPCPFSSCVRPWTPRPARARPAHGVPSMKASIRAATCAGKGAVRRSGEVGMRVHALEDRGEHAPCLVHHEHQVMDQLRAPREDAGPDHHGVPDVHLGGIPEVVLEIEAAHARRREVIRGEPEHRVHRVPASS